MSVFLRYIIVGGCALGLHLAVLKGLLLAQACEPWVASAIGFIAAVGLNYTAQWRWVFRSNRSHAIALPRYVAITGVMLGVNTAVFGLLFNLGVPLISAQTITTACVFVVNFLVNRRFTFGTKNPAIS